MIGFWDVAARILDVLSAQRLDCAAHAVGGVHDRGDPGAAPPGECLASAGRPSSPVLGRPRSPQRAGPAATQGLSPTSVPHLGTLVRGHADLVRRRWTAKRQQPRRPPTSSPLRRLVLRLAGENPSPRRGVIEPEMAAVVVSPQGFVFRWGDTSGVSVSDVRRLAASEQPLVNTWNTMWSRYSDNDAPVSGPGLGELPPDKLWVGNVREGVRARAQ